MCEKISVNPMTFNTMRPHSHFAPSTLPLYRWNITKIVECAQLRRDIKIDVGDAVLVPLFVIFIIAAVVNFPLMWLQIVHKTKKLQHGVRPTRNRTHSVITHATPYVLCSFTHHASSVAHYHIHIQGKNLGKGPTCAAISIVAVFVPALIILRAAGMYFISNLLVAFTAGIGIILYLVAAAKISAKLGASGQHIVTLARKIAGWLAGVLIANLLYFVYPIFVREETQPVANVVGSVLIINFIQPLCYSSLHYCILHFLLSTIKKKRKVRPRTPGIDAGSATSASTAPAQSSSQAWTATVPDSPSSSGTGSK